MVRRTRQRRGTSNRRRNTRRPRPRRVRPRKKVAIHRTPANIIVRGVRSLMGLIPGGDALKSIADFAFSSIAGARGLGGSTDIFGLNCVLFPSLASALLDSPMMTRSGTNLYVNYIDGKLFNLAITVEPTNKISDRSGSWGLMFTPFRTSGDYAKYAAGALPTLNNLMAHPGVVIDRADKPLTLTFRPTVRDGYIGLDIPIADPFGMICVAFQDEVRANYTKFTADEFSAKVRIAVTASLRSSSVVAAATSIDAKIKSLSKEGVEFVTLVNADRTQQTVSCAGIEDTDDGVRLIPLASRRDELMG